MRQGEVTLRETGQTDLPALAALYPAAFPREALWPVVSEVLQDGSCILSLGAFAETNLVGHVVFTTCEVEGSAARVALLAPLAVAPEWQRTGIGTALVHAGLGRLRASGVAVVLVLGDPAYYGRFGFAPEADILPPYALPPEWAGAWRSLRQEPTGSPHRGRLIVPRPWRRPGLWAP